MDVTHAAAGLFRNRNFALYWTQRFLANFAVQILSVSVGWLVYDLTRDPFDLGIVGLVQFLPSLVLVLVTGTVADRFNRRVIMGLCLALEASVAALILILTLRQDMSVWPIFVLLAALGVARAFYNPAASSLLTNIVAAPDLAQAIAWSTSAWQAATIIGPVAGGLLYGLSAQTSFGTALAMLMISSLCALLIERPVQQRDATREAGLKTLLAGFSYVWREKVVLGAISLDLFAVLLGGATALLPVYARDILDAGPWGLGLLRAAPGVGAIIVAGLLGRYPIRDHAGRIMFLFVALFGAFTVLFGLSRSLWLSVPALALMGASDMVSVYVRETLLQLWTPDAVRGRVNAVNMVFVGASNELGEFRAGIMAALIGATGAVVVGGFGTVAVAVIWAAMFPALRQARHLDGRT